MVRYFIGVDWADQEHRVCVLDEQGQQVLQKVLANTPEALSEFGRWLFERCAEGILLQAAIEKPEGRIVDFLLDHGVEVYPINPKALDRVRDLSDARQAAIVPASPKAMHSMPLCWLITCGPTNTACLP